MTPEQTETALLALTKHFEEFSAKFLLAVETKSHDRPAAEWYTPKGMLLRFLRIGANVTSAPEIKAGCAVLHGALDVLGFSGTLKLVLELRRKHASNKTKQ